MIDTKELEKNKKHNLKIYYIYKTFSWDLLFYYAVSFMFLTNYMGLTAAEIIFADAFFPFFKILFQIPATLLIERYGKKSGLIVGNISLAIYMLFILGCKNMYILLIGNIFMALGFVLKSLCESNLLYDSLPNIQEKRKLFSKIDGKSASFHYLFEAGTCIASGFLYTINPNIPMVLCLICVLISLMLAHLFKTVPVDITNEDEEHSTKKTLSKRLKEYMRNLKNAFKFIFSSSRLRSLIYFNAIMISLIYLLTSYRRSLFADIGISAKSIGIIYAALGLISSIYSGITPQLHKIFRNKMLTYMGLYFALSIFLSGLAVFLNLPFNIMIIIVLASQAIQFGIKGPYYTLIKQYLSSFASSSMRVKIISASNLIEGFVSGLVSLLGAFLLTKMSTAASSIIIGTSFFAILSILLNYMKTHVGLKPEEYSNREINFKEVE